MNRFRQACTMVIAVALAAIAWKLWATPTPVFAAQHYAYKSFSDMNFNTVTRTLNQDAADGWEPVSVFEDARSGVPCAGPSGLRAAARRRQPLIRR